MNHERRQRIAEALIVEFERQGEAHGRGAGPRLYEPRGPIDIEALAEAIDRLLEGGGVPGQPPVEGPTPDELNASNDG